MPEKLIGSLLTWRFLFSGGGRIAGEPPVAIGAPDGRVTIGGVPVARRVVLFDTAEMRPIAATVSASNGTYQFTGLLTEVEPGVPIYYSLIAYDDTGTYDAVIRDRIAPVVP